jgi:hypothetical protein
MCTDGREDPITREELLLCRWRAGTPECSSHFVPLDARIDASVTVIRGYLLSLITGREKRLKLFSAGQLPPCLAFPHPGACGGNRIILLAKIGRRVGLPVPSP